MAERYAKVRRSTFVPTLATAIVARKFRICPYSPRARRVGHAHLLTDCSVSHMVAHTCTTISSAPPSRVSPPPLQLPPRIFFPLISRPLFRRKPRGPPRQAHLALLSYGIPHPSANNRWASRSAFGCIRPHNCKRNSDLPLGWLRLVRRS